MDYSQLIVVQCDPSQKRQTRANHYKQWGAPLGFEERGWIDRFAILEQDKWAEEDRYVTWALVPNNAPDTLDMLAHCETFRRPSAAVEPGSASPKSVTSYGIASVYTPESKRGKGYARHLLRLIHYIIAPPTLLPPFPSPWGATPDVSGFCDAEFSVLYSGVGDKYYASCRQGDGASSEAGWIRQKTTMRTWDIASHSDLKVDPDQVGWKWLGPDDLSGLEAMTSEEITTSLEGGSHDRYRFAILPSWSLFRIHALRSEISPASQKNPNRPYGLMLPAEGDDEALRPFATWTFPESVSDDPQLEITFVRHPFPFEAIVAAARKAKCSKITMWGPRGGWDDFKPEMDHDSQMPCYVVYGRKSEECDWEWPEQ